MNPGGMLKMGDVSSETPVKGGSVRQTRKRQWKDQFLKRFKITGNVADAARFSGVERVTVYRTLKSNPRFKEKFDDAFEESTDRLEQLLLRAASNINNKMGVVALMFALKARRPHIYRDNYQPRPEDGDKRAVDTAARIRQLVGEIDGFMGQAAPGGDSSNGRTAGFDPANGGSIPPLPATEPEPEKGPF